MALFVRAVYTLIALAIVGGYAYSAYRGVELSTARERQAPAGIRGRAGVAPIFWYGGGYRGGK
ncbi:MAG TPA: hypothetical protein VNI54_12800 [Thermoanaerobaculia bacterium]|nr:hypothetical protein [Thermoanaerobaculia bacterium]